MPDRVVTSRVHPELGVESDGPIWQYRARITHCTPDRWSASPEYLNAAGEWTQLPDRFSWPTCGTRDEAVAAAHEMLDRFAFVSSSEVVQEREEAG